jgi:hypothetical protein
MPGQTQKGNPAHKRMSNEKHKATRQRGWLSAKRRKELRITGQRGRERQNAALRAAGEPTPWEAACAERRARRVAAGLPAAWAKRQVS